MNRLAAFAIASCLVACVSATGQDDLRNMLWVWGNPEMGRPGAHTSASFAEAAPMERARILGVPHVIMAGNGVPNSDETAEHDMLGIDGAERVVWEISPSKASGASAFDYSEVIGRVTRLAAQYPKIEGVLLDDMSTVAVSAGLKPEHICAIRDQLGTDNARIRIWGVVYTMNLHDPALAAYVQELDVINLWTWHARDLPQLEENVAYCAAQWPDKPIVVGLYLHDYGEGRSIPADLAQQQNETALALVRDKRIAGIVYLTITNEPETVSQTAGWIREHTGQSPAERLLHLSGSQTWNFSGDAWSEDAEGVMRPPDQRNLHSRAFCTKETYGDVIVEFDYNGDYRETGTGDAGVILRASDPNHFYYVHFPWGGQQLRAKHFWAARPAAFERERELPGHRALETGKLRVGVFEDDTGIGIAHALLDHPSEELDFTAEIEPSSPEGKETA